MISDDYNERCVSMEVLQKAALAALVAASSTKLNFDKSKMGCLYEMQM